MKKKMNRNLSKRTDPSAPKSPIGAESGLESPTISEMRECIECLWGVVQDVLPQIGRIVLQDYERLNRGAILARSIVRQRVSTSGADGRAGRSQSSKAQTRVLKH